MVGLAATAALAGTSLAPAAAESQQVRDERTQVESAAEATVLAAKSSRRVEILSERTESSKSFANPDGSKTSELASGPVRFKDSKGDWREIDLTAVQSADGSVTAAVAEKAVTLPPTAAGVVRVPTSEGAVTITHPGAADVGPVLDGSKVTYPGAVGGRDLIQQLLVSGVEETVVLDSSAEGNSYTTQFTLPAGATTRAIAGGVEFVSAQGNALGRFGGGLAFDAAGADAAVATTLVSQNGRVATVRAAINPSWVADSRRQFPVHLDPVYTWKTVDGGSSDSYVMSGGGATTPYWTSSEIRVGYGYGAGTDVARGLVRIDMGRVTATNMTVQSAHLTVQNIQSSSCTASVTRLWGMLTGFHSATTWSALTSNGTSTAYFDSAYTSQTSGAYGATGCAVQNVNLDATALVRDWAVMDPTARTNLGMQLTMPENSTAGWKKYRSGDGNPAAAPLLSITYDRRPNTPTSLATSPTTACMTGTARPFINTTRPTFTGTAADVDSASTRLQFDIWQTGGAATVVAGYTGYSAPTTAKSWTVPSGTPLSHGVNYSWRSRSQDSLNFGLSWTGWCEFTVDTTSPAAPTVTSSAYPANAWQSTTSPGGFTFASSGHSDVSTWQYQFGNGDIVNAPGQVGALNSSTTLTITPPPGSQTLKVWAVDRAGNRTGPTSYTFGSGTLLTSPEDGTVTAKQVKLTAAASSGSEVSFFYKLPTATTWQAVPTSAVTSGGNTISSWPVTTVGAGGGVTSPELILNIDQLPDIGSSSTDASVQLMAKFGTGGTVTSDTSLTPIAVALDHNAFGGGFATQQVGPGTVSLLNGNYSLSSVDASATSYGADLSLARTFNSKNPTASGVFGPGWSDSVGVDGAFYTDLADLGGTVNITAVDGSILQFTKTTSGYVGHGAAESFTLGTAGTVTNGPASFVLRDADEVQYKFTVGTGFGGAASVTAPHSYPLKRIIQPGSSSSRETQYGFDAQDRVTRVLAPAPPTVTCSPTVSSYSGTTTTDGMGCRALDLIYGVIVVNGTNVERLTQATLRTTDGTGTSVNIPLVCYAYDTAGRLSKVWDPRITGTSCGSAPGSSDLPTAYTYDSLGRVSTITPPGQAAWDLSYDNGATAATSKFIQASRQHTGGTWGTAAEATMVQYGAAFGSTTSATHPDLSANTIDDWDQRDQPTTAVAIYPSGGIVASGGNGWDYRDATVYALNFAGQQVNTARFSGTDQAGWKIDTTEYDDQGNVVRSLTAGNRDRALRRSDAPAGTVELPSSSAEAARVLDTTYLYAPNADDDMSDLVDVFGPLHLTVIPDSTRPEGTLVAARAHTHYDYDTGDETGHPYDVDPNTQLPLSTKSSQHLVTSEWTEASPSGGVFLGTSGPVGTDRRTTTHSYSLGSSTAGWTFSTPLQTTVQPGNGAASITSTTLLDPATGMVTETRQPKDAATASAGSTQTIYYGDDTTNNSNCKNRAWYMQICKVQPVAQPTTSGMAGLPVTSTTYDWLLRPATVLETVTDSSNATQTRSTTTTYENSGWGPRPVSNATSNSISSGAQILPTITTTYDSTTGLPTTLTAGGSFGSLTTAYDDFGRPYSFTDADGGTATTSYDSNGRVASTSDKIGGAVLRTSTYTYNGGNERRGLPTQIETTPGIGTFIGSYDADGRLLTQTYPNGISATRTSDEAGAESSLTYAKSGTTWFADTQRHNIHRQVRTHDGLPSTQIYKYDDAGRLIEARDSSLTQDTSDYNCTTRKYGFDANSNRETLTTYGANTTDGGCQTTTQAGTPVSLGFDTADRLLSSGRATGITYDAFGRTLLLPAALTTVSGTGGSNVTHSYYANDLILSQTSGTTIRTWQLDPTLQRFRSYTDNSTGTTITKTNHFSSARGDSPTWIDEGNGTQTRYTPGLDGNVAATDSRNSSTGATSGLVYNLNNLHGDLVTTATTNATLYDGPISDTDEYGNQKTTTSGRYGWLGSKQRSTETLGGLTLMGVRLYSTVTGRFLSVDPVRLGGAHAYDYCGSDPVNCVDLSGKISEAEMYARWAALKRAYWAEAIKAQEAIVARIDAKRWFGLGGYKYPSDLRHATKVYLVHWMRNGVYVLGANYWGQFDGEYATDWQIYFLVHWRNTYALLVRTTPGVVLGYLIAGTFNTLINRYMRRVLIR